MARANFLKLSAGLACLFAVAGCAGNPDAQKPPAARRIDPAVVAASMCGSPAAAAVDAKKPMPLISGLAPVHYAVTSSDPQVQAYVDQGFALLYGFEYEKAKRSFAAAWTLDPDCAMCAWGEAMAMGPNINSDDMSPADSKTARELVAKALMQTRLPDTDRALLDALAQRYAPGAPKGQRGVYAEAYANAMIAAAQRWPKDDVIAMLAAEAAMNVHPWDYWQGDARTPLPWAAKAMTLVETVLARNPDQPEAIHLYIHLTEASTDPGRAEKYADKLGALAPQSAHLVHMPSHTYYRLGRFAESIVINERAVELDEAMARRLGEDPKFYGYFFHHTGFIMSAASQIGDGATALKMAAQLEEAVPFDKALKTPRLQGALIMALQTRLQFQNPADILALGAPDARMKKVQPFWHAARAEAFARTGDLPSARREVVLMQKARNESGAAEEILTMERLAYEGAQGRVALAAHDYAGAVGHFRAAAEIEKTLPYNEPPFAGRPADVALGHALLAAGNAPGARQAFEEALRVRPGNGWAMWGLAEAKRATGDAVGAQSAAAAFDKVWHGAGRPTLASL